MKVLVDTSVWSSAPVAGIALRIAVEQLRWLIDQGRVAIIGAIRRSSEWPPHPGVKFERLWEHSSLPRRSTGRETSNGGRHFNTVERRNQAQH
jgi:hypothetical protein